MRRGWLLRRRRVGHMVAGLAALLLLVTTTPPAATSQAQEDPPPGDDLRYNTWWPPSPPEQWPLDWWEPDISPPFAGLPGLDCTERHTSPLRAQFGCPIYGLQWAGTSQVGTAGSKRAQQWVRVPPTVLAAHTVSSKESVVLPGTGAGGASPSIGQVAHAWAWFVSPDGSEQNYGLSPPIPVRTVAFGSLPIEATLQVNQVRNSEGLPMPLTVATKNMTYSVAGDPRLPDSWSTGEPRAARFPAHVRGRVFVEVRHLQVDGVPLELRGQCRTSSPAQLALTSRYLAGSKAQAPSSGGEFRQDRGYKNNQGGTLTGVLDVPAFEGCRTASGEDLSRLLTATISGPDNPLTARLGTFSCYSSDPDNPAALVPPGPGEDTPREANCFKGGGNQVAPGIKRVPSLPFPDHSPRDHIQQLPWFPPQVPHLPPDHPGSDAVLEY